jgi:hypothetical protein
MFCLNTCVIVGSSSVFKMDEHKADVVDFIVQTYDDVNFISDDRYDVISVDVPWMNTFSDLLEWWIRVEYNGVTFDEQVPIDITDFQDRFLKHPEYGVILTFDVDDDAMDDIEVIVGFYWSVINDENGNSIKSLEKRVCIRLLETGDYLTDDDAEVQVWSELHVNYGLIKKSIKNSFVGNVLFNDKPDHPVLNLFKKILLNMFNGFYEVEPFPLQDDSDYFSIGAGLKSKSGEVVPRYIEKRFAFARESMFSPTIFQHIMDPGPSKGTTSIELLYGFQAFSAGSLNPSYDIGFSVEHDPAVYIKTKFIPLSGYVYYYFNDASSRYTTTNVTFSSDISTGSGESTSITLSFDSIDDSLARDGRWMSFDINLFGDNDPLGGQFNYRASNEFDVGLFVNSVLFDEKVKVKGLPTLIDVSWDIDFLFSLTPVFYAKTSGFFDVYMNDDIESIRLFYPVTEQFEAGNIFLEIDEGLPSSTRVEAEAEALIDFSNLLSSQNFIYGKVSHECSSPINSVKAYLPDVDLPIDDNGLPLVIISDIPALAVAEAKLWWNRLQGFAYVSRESSDIPDPVEINIGFAGYRLNDVLEIRQGYVDTRFKLDNQGYFYFDTSPGIIGNTLTVSNSDTGDQLILSVGEVSADELQADWWLDTSGDNLRVRDLSFSGMIDSLKDLELQLFYQGKNTMLNLNWILGQTGNFDIQVDQDDDLTIDFGEFAQGSPTIDMGGSITISQHLAFDMNWKLKQGTGDGSGSVDPGFFVINENVADPNIKHFDFYVTYQDKYGVAVTFDNLAFYLNLKWWKGERLLPYIWLDYEVSANDFDVDLLWTNSEGVTQWYYNVEDW